jgi:hypothetical protein
MGRWSTQPATGKAGRYIGLQIVLKSGSFNLLERTRPVKTCTGIGLPFRIRGTCAMFNFVIFYVLKIQYYSMRNYKFILCSIWVWNSVSHIKKRR